MRTTVTIARQFGCGGSVIGQRVADKLGIRCIDREIVSQTAEAFQMDEEELATREEKVCSFWERVLNGMVLVAPEASYISAPVPTLTDEDIFKSETEVMTHIAQTEDCVIVGRAAVHILPPHPGMVNVFLHAPLDFRIQRVMEYHQGKDENECRNLIRRSDEMRSKFISIHTGKETFDARNYHVCLDTSILPLDEITEIILQCVRRKLGINDAIAVTSTAAP